MYTIVIPEDIAESGKNFLRDRGYKLVIGTGKTDLESLKELVKNADGIIARNAAYPKEVLENAVNLKVISRHGVGLDKIDLEYCNDNGIYITYTPEANSLSVAEHTIGFILALSHQFRKLDNEVRKGNWGIRNEIKTYDCNGKTLGLIGFGRIAKKVAKIAVNGLGMKVIVCRSSKRYDDIMNEVEIVDSIDEVFERSDFVSLHTPSTKDTIGLVDIKLMKKMKNPSFLINTSRGNVVVEKDLYKALSEGIITGAAVDVLEKEPPEIDNPLFSLDNIIITPHCSTHTKETMDVMSLHAAMGLNSILSGEELKWVANNPKKIKD